MHGPAWLSSPIIYVILFGLAVYAISRSIRHRNDIRNIEKVFGLDILDTSREWLFFTSFLGLAALGAHLLAEFIFHLYDVTPIDRFTHGLSGMAITAVILNFRLTRNRKVYYAVGIGVAWVAFIAWEIFEGIYFFLNPLGIIQTAPWDVGIDLWIDFLGGMSTCFLCDELTE